MIAFYILITFLIFIACLIAFVFIHDFVDRKIFMSIPVIIFCAWCIFFGYDYYNRKTIITTRILKSSTVDNIDLIAVDSKLINLNQLLSRKIEPGTKIIEKKIVTDTILFNMEEIEYNVEEFEL